MDLSVPHRHTVTGVLIIIFFIVFFNSPCYASSTTPPENHTEISNSSIPHECIKLFSGKRNFSDACSTCKETGGELYGITVITQQPNKEIQKIFIDELIKRGDIWVDVPNKTFCEQNKTEKCSKALTNINTTVTDISCSSNLEFFCYYNDKESGYANCSSITSTATPSTTTTSGETHSATPTELPNIEGIVIPVAVGIVLFVIAIAIAIAAGCFIIKRSGKRNDYEEGGENLEPENETREASQIPLNDIIVRSEEVKEDPDEETYNILRLSSKNGSESQVTESNGKKIYDHLRFGEKEDDYDTTCLSRLDGGPVDKPYDKTYFG